MIKAIMIVSALLFLATEWFIYRSEVRRLHLVARRIYIWYSIAAYVLFVAVLLIFRFATDPPECAMRLLIWIVWLFLLCVIPKVAYFAVSRLGIMLRRPRSWRIAAIVLAVAVGVTMIWGATTGRSHIEVRPVTVEFKRLPKSFDGTRIALFADVHLGNVINSHRQLSKLVDTINACEPDIVVFGGDMVNLKSAEFTPAIAAILGRIQSRYGNYAVLGNHDMGLYVRDTVTHPYRENIDETVARYEQTGWRMLINRTEYISNGADSISLSGVSFPVSKRFDGRAADLYPEDLPATFTGVPDNIFNICVSHTPDMWDGIRQTPHGDLTLSGHTHAMQLKISLFGLKCSPAMFKYRDWSGLYRRDGKYLYVNDGIGYVLYPMRIGTLPEVTLITLKSASQ